jgi:FkbM family methyltransferase
MLVKKLLRDNPVANFMVRNVIRMGHQHFGWFKKLVNQYRIYGTILLQINGVKFSVFARADDFIANELYYNLGYELHEFNLLAQLLKNARYLVDVGANTGIVSLYASKVNDKLSVICFEPHPSNFTRLVTNLSLNNQVSNIKPFQKAIGSQDAEISFTVPADSGISTTASANAEFTRNFHRISHKEILVQQTTLDEVLRDIPLTSADILKIDVEYYELEVLKGAESTLVQKRPLVMIEILQYESLVDQFPEMKEKISKDHADQVFDFLIQCNYYGYSIESNELSLIHSMAGQGNRNFIFIPYKLKQSRFSFEEVEVALSVQ